MKTQTTIKLVTITALFGMLLAFTGCSTIVRGVNQDVSIDSIPAGAVVVVKNELTTFSVKATTPAVVRLSRSGRYTATITKDGYNTESASITPKMSGAGVGASAGNLLIGGVIGLSVDMFSGAMYDLSPNPLMVTMTAVKPVEDEVKPVEDPPKEVVASTATP